MFFDTLDDSFSDILKEAFKSLDYSKLIDFFSIRNVFRPMIMSIIEDLNLRIMDDTDSNYYLLQKNEARTLQIM